MTVKNTDARERLRNIGLDALIISSLVTLIIGLFAPVMNFRKLVVINRTFSIASGLESLFQDGYFLLFAIIFTFSVLFPLGKLLLMGWIRCFRPLPRDRVARMLDRLSMVSKWSMLDVFVVAMLVVMIRMDLLGRIRPRWGIYLFALSVILSTWAVGELKRRFRSEGQTGNFSPGESVSGIEPAQERAVIAKS